MHRIIFIYLFLLLSYTAYSQDSEWNKCDDCESGNFYYQKVDKENYKVTAKVRINSPIKDVYKVVSDIESYNNWVYNNDYVDLVEEKTQFSGILYLLINTPFPLNDIDAILNYNFEILDSAFILRQNCLPDYYPVNKKLQRILRYDAVWKFKMIDSNTTELYYLVKMGGPRNLPDFILKVLLCSGPKTTLDNLRNLCVHLSENQRDNSCL